MGMNMELVTLKNGMKLNGVVSDRPARPAGASGFAAQLAQVAEAAKQAEASGSTKLQAAYNSLTPGSKAVLGRISVGASDITKDEWKRLRQELAAAGLLTQDELFYSDPDIVVLGDAGDFADGTGFISGCYTVSYEETGGWETYADIKWGGDPFEFLDQWLEMLCRERDAWDKADWSDGVERDTAARTRQIEAHEKVSNLVKQLIKLI